MRGGSSEGERKEWKSARKTEFGLESGDDE